MLAKGGSDKHEALFKGFATVVLQSSAPPKETQKTYDLSLFKDPNLVLKTEPADYLRPIRVIGIRLRFAENFNIEPGLKWTLMIATIISTNCFGRNYVGGLRSFPGRRY